MSNTKPIEDSCVCFCHKKPEGWPLTNCPINCPHCKHCQPEAYLREPDL